MKTRRNFVSYGFVGGGGAALLGMFLAISAQAQISLTLDDANQSVPVPASGVTTVDFSGTVVVCPGCFMIFSQLDNPYNNTDTASLMGSLDAAFATFSSGGSGTYTGPLFSIDVPMGTAPDLYAFALVGGPSELHLFGASAGGSMFEPTADFSVQVTAVPEPSVELLLFAAAIGAFFYRIWIRPKAVARRLGHDPAFARFVRALAERRLTVHGVIR